MTQSGLQSYYDDQQGQIEKFTELIVRECAQFVEDNFDLVGDEIIVKEKMLNYFGVEQDSEEEPVEIYPRRGDEWSGTSCGIDDCGWIVGDKQ